jgi:FtsH-binding integral membrane protein
MLHCRLFSVLFLLILTGLLQVVLQSAFIDRLLGLVGAAVFCVFIIYDTHMIMHRVSAEEYMFATINLYLDIINLFLHLLRLMAESRRN